MNFRIASTELNAQDNFYCFNGLSVRLRLGAAPLVIFGKCLFPRFWAIFYNLSPFFIICHQDF
jgi:hypothetical protein